MAGGICDPPHRLPVSGSSQQMSSRWVAWGVAAAILYVLVVGVVAARLPVRILYDGFGPLPPYRWVRPPASHLGSNERPTGGTGTIELSATGSDAVSLATDDGQAILIVPRDGVVPRSGESLAEVKLTPLDPEQVTPPLAGRRFDGNAYKVEGVYKASQAPLVLRKPATVVLRYPSEATELWWYAGSQWTEVRTDAGLVEASLQVYGSSTQLGTFVAAAPLVRSRPSAGWVAYGLAAVGLVVVVVGVLLSRRGGAGRTRLRRRRTPRG